MSTGLGDLLEAAVGPPRRMVDSAMQWTVLPVASKYRMWAGHFGQQAAAEEVRALYGDVIAGGPFIGMRYDVPAEIDQCLGPKLLGQYESELFDVVEQLCKTPWTRIVNVGCAGGYYLTGFAMRCPGATSYGFEIEPHLQDVARAMAAANGVAGRVEVGGLCSPERLDELGGPDTLVLVDIEGGEDELLRLDAAPSLAASTLLVELHDFARPGVSSTLLARFRDTHDAIIIAAVAKDWVGHPAAAAVSRRYRRWALDEQRPPGMRWLVLSPRPS